MSYDILFVPRRHGQSWEAALDEAEGRDVLGDAIRPERLQQWERVVAALRQRLDGIEVTVDDDTCEASHPSGLQVSLYPDEASISFPYRDRADRQAFHDLVVDAVGILERETGLHAWDAQTAEPFDGRVHDETGLAATRRIGQETSDVSATDAMAERAAAGHIGPDTGPVDVTALPAAAPPAADQPAADQPATDQPAADQPAADQPAVDQPATAQPAVTEGTSGAGAGTTAGRPAPGAPVGGEADLAQQRRRALRYVAVGVVVVVAALLLRSQGEPSTLSGLALAVGVADVVIGVLLYRGWSRRTAQAGRSGSAPTEGAGR